MMGHRKLNLSILTLLTILELGTSFSCNANINVKWLSYAPYIYSKNNQTTGILPLLLKNMMKVCCGDTSSLVFQEEVDKSRLHQLIGKSQNESLLVLPFFGKINQKKILKRSYVSMVESPGVLYLVDEQKALVASEYVLLNSVTSAWPVMCILYLCAAISGIVVWALDCYWNPDQFPLNFFKGSFDGFWWACVTMSTVGYGDRAPKSITARIFAFIWILTGLVAVNVFTATVTAHFTDNSLRSTVFRGEKVGVINETSIRRCISSKDVTVKNVTDIKELISGISSSGELNGGILDAYVAGHYKNVISKNHNLRVLKVIDCITVYGLVMTGEYETSKFGKCMKNYFSLYQTKITADIQTVTNLLEKSPTTISEERSLHIFYSDGLLFRYSVIICSVLVLLAVAVGAAWQYWKKKSTASAHVKKNDITNIRPIYEKTMEELFKRQTLELEIAMKKEVDQFLSSWNKKKHAILNSETRLAPHKINYLKIS